MSVGDCRSCPAFAPRDSGLPKFGPLAGVITVECCGDVVPGSPATRLAGRNVTKILRHSLGRIAKMRLLRSSAS